MWFSDKTNYLTNCLGCCYQLTVEERLGKLQRSRPEREREREREVSFLPSSHCVTPGLDLLSSLLSSDLVLIMIISMTKLTPISFGV